MAVSPDVPDGTERDAPSDAHRSDLEREQAYIDRAYERIQEMREAAAARRDEVLAVRTGTPQFMEERDVIVRSALARLEQLKLGDEPLCFGRIDHTTGDAYYIGRLAVSDHDQEPLIVDWRAPIAEPFYRATGRHPMGLVRRRHFIAEGPRLLGIEDELLDVDALTAADESHLIGEGALLAALERSRSGQMRDIVATIQAEQDDIIRAPMQGVLVVQGGPGTGKTAVALHRAAYLLYTHRFPLERQGVLVVGPNPLFLRYIEHVLPSLGETGVTLSTVSGLYEGRARAAGHDDPRVAKVKGDVRMADVVRRAVRDRERALTREAVISYGAYTLRLAPQASGDIVATARRRPGTHNARRPFVENQVLRRLYGQYERAVGRLERTQVRTATSGGAGDFADFADDVAQTPEFRDALDRMWPVLTPEELLHDLFGAKALIELAAQRHLREDERDLLHRPRSRSFDEIRWTVADMPLLDEAFVQLGPRKRRAADDAGVRTYGHIVVDEAQDLSPMQLRMLNRRSLNGSMTVVGDIGQGTGPFSPHSWDELLAHLPAKKASTEVELSVNYRTPSEIMEVAARVLAAAAPDLVPPTSVRSTGVPPAVERVEPGALATAALAAGARLHDELGGTIAVICPPSLSAALGAVREEEVSLDADVSVVPVASVKGLEFDGVVVVEPALIAEESPQGMRALYVSLTRATKRLTIVHSRALPTVLGLGELSARSR
ncbi:MAG TPA: AAA family ATPase [Acidimicrobiales bacterium]|nr:AAA family ATPase [Acidimicrobiales bacterium]